MLMYLPAQAGSDPLGDIKNAVLRYNTAQFKLLHNPTDAKLKQSFLDSVQPGTKAEKDTLKLLERYISANSHLLDVSTHEVKIVDVIVHERRHYLTVEDANRTLPESGETASVVTEETSNWASSSGRKFVQTKNKHTYYLIKERGKDWRVAMDEFNLQ